MTYGLNNSAFRSYLLVSGILLLGLLQGQKVNATVFNNQRLSNWLWQDVGTLSLTNEEDQDTCSIGVTFACFNLSTDEDSPVNPYPWAQAMAPVRLHGGAGAISLRTYEGFPGVSKQALTAWWDGGSDEAWWAASGYTSSTKFTVAIVYAADKATFDSYMQTGTGAPTDYAYKTYQINLYGSEGCQGPSCPQYDPSNDSITPESPFGAVTCDENGLQGSVQEFYGRFNVSTSTAYLYGPDPLTGASDYYPALQLSIMKEQTDSTWKELVNKYYPIARGGYTGLWTYNSTLSGGLTRTDPNGDYIYILSLCYLKPDGYGGATNIECVASTDSITYTVDNQTFFECRGLPGFTASTTPYWIQLAKDITSALFGISYSGDLFDSMIADATSSAPLSYWWGTKMAIEAAAVSSTYSLVMPFPKAAGGMSAISLNLGGMVKNNPWIHLDDGTKWRIYVYLGYLYDLITWGTVIYWLFRLFGIRLNWSGAAKEFANPTDPLAGAKQRANEIRQENWKGPLSQSIKTREARIRGKYRY